MIIRRRSLLLDSKLYSEEYGVKRSAGVHVGQIIEKIGLDEGSKKPYDMTDVALAEAAESYRTAGFVWEHVIAEHIENVEHQRRGYLVRPGEHWWCSQCDEFMPTGAESEWHEAAGHVGIFLTPDGINLTEWCLEEWKWTWRSSNRCVTQGLEEDADGWTEDAAMLVGIREWPKQSMAYCKALGFDRCLFRVFFVNNDYRDMRPKAYTFELTFNQRELDNNWKLIVATAREAGWLP